MTLLKQKKTVRLPDEIDDISELLQMDGWQKTRFELIKPKNKSITLRMSEDLLKEVKTKAKKLGLDYQKFIRLALESAVKK
jgi:predicted DNA binding CopG/RHH family protein